MPVVVRSYTSPTLVLLAFDWPPGAARGDFLGFAIERAPGFGHAARSSLPNRIGFDGPKADGGDFPSDQAPIQKFYWWDARIDTPDRGTTFRYRVVPIVGAPGSLTTLDGEAADIDVRIPEVEEHGITTHFNRAVVSSQGFARAFPELKTATQIKAAEAWLANGMERAVPDFLERGAGKAIEGAIYHLSDQNWIIPALVGYGGSVALAYNQTTADHATDAAIAALVAAGRPATAFRARSHANIMHNKFLVRVGPGGAAEAVLAGSANFTGEGLSAQANVLHAFESPELAALYLARKRLLDDNPALAATQHEQTGWSAPIAVGDATVRAFFPPEPKATRASLAAIVDAVRAAQHSVVMCAYDPTDMDLINGVFAAADAGKMMLALINRVPAKEPTGDPSHADVAAAAAIFHRAEANHDIVGFDAFGKGETPTGFLPERVLWPGEDPKIMVRVHHKFVVVDAEGDRPVVFTGSANFSGNSLHNNDENLLEITDCPRLAGLYLAEFLRLYEHYRARRAFDRREAGDSTSFKLAPDNSWSRKYFVAGSPEAKARIAMAGSA
jgi:phosphatidylserine/phosphatidylglycerophosphate/cardiolipin synthase-like enzyme